MAKPKIIETFGRWHWHGEAERKVASMGRKTKASTKKYAHTKLFYKVTCSCGSGVEKWLRSEILTKGLSQSCGCLQRISASQRAIKRAQERGPSKKDNPLYEIWNGMHQRCYNENATGYNRYGGRGITICDEWRRPNPEGLTNFARYMGERPSNELTVDRIDNDGNYEPGNVRWASRKLQAENTSRFPFCRLTDLRALPWDFGFWEFSGVVERRYEASDRSTRFYLCKCKLCSSEHWVRKQDLKAGKSTKCTQCSFKIRN